MLIVFHALDSGRVVNISQAGGKGLWNGSKGIYIMNGQKNNFLGGFKMKQRMQGMVMGILVTTLLLGTVTAFAATTRTIEATFGGVRTMLHGQEFAMNDFQGAPIESLTYSGRLFVPVEKILHAMGENVQWNAQTAVLNFGTPAGADTPAQAPTSGRPLVEVAPRFEGGGTLGLMNRMQTVNMRGESFTNTFVFNGAGWSHHNLNRQFTTLTGTIGRVDGSGTVPRTITFIGDGRELASFVVGDQHFPENIAVNVAGVTTLRIEVTNNAGGSRVNIGFTNVMLH